MSPYRPYSSFRCFILFFRVICSICRPCQHETIYKSSETDYHSSGLFAKRRLRLVSDENMAGRIIRSAGIMLTESPPYIVYSARPCRSYRQS